MSEEPNLNEIIKRLEAVEHKLGIYYHTSDAVDGALEELFENVDNRTLQQILHEVDAKILAKAVLGLKSKALLNLKDALSKNAWEMLRDDIRDELRSEIGLYGLQNSKIKVLTITHQLEEMGEIVWARTTGSLETEEYRKKCEEEIKENKEWYALQTLKNKELEIWKNEVFEKLNKV